MNARNRFELDRIGHRYYLRKREHNKNISTGKCQTACKPGSVPARAGDDHSSGTPVTGRLARPTRTAASETRLTL